MRSMLAGLVLLGLVVGRPGSGRAEEYTQGGEFGLAVGAAASNVLYFPAKLVVATGGLVLGALTGVLTGGDVRSAYAVWVPAASGTYILKAGHLDGSVPVEFFGADYGDRASRRPSAMEAGGIYDAIYRSH